MSFNDGVKTTPIAYFGVLSVLVTIIIVMMLQVVYLGQRDKIVGLEGRVTKPAVELSDLTSQQLTALTKREMVDRDRRIVTIGITRAMELVVSELNQGRSPGAVIGPSRFAVDGSGVGVKSPDDGSPGETAFSDGDTPAEQPEEGSNDEPN
jgi:hypothetical protein